MVIFLDYTRVFDTINHNNMSALLHFIGCSNESIGLLCSYLRDIIQFVETSAVASKMNPIYTDVPQCPLLGSLFISYTSHLTK